MMIDSHHHLWKYSAAEYGWITPQMPAIKRDFLPEDLEQLMHYFGIEGTVAVQARQTLDETSWLLELAGKHPLIRGVVCGLMIALGGLGHTLPYLIPDFNLATMIAVLVVVVELGAISYIRHHFMDTPLLSALFQVVVGGVLVFLTGILIGSS